MKENNQKADDLAIEASRLVLEWKNQVCGDCIYYTGEECNGNEREGCETYDDSKACCEFEPLEENH